MPTKFERTSIESILNATEQLKKAAEQLTQVALDMQQHGMQDARFPWTQRQWDSLDVVITLVNQCAAVLPSQISATSQNGPLSILPDSRRNR